MLPDVYILLSRHKEEVHSYSIVDRCIHLVGLHRNLCLKLYYYVWVMHLKTKTLLNWERHKREIQLCCAVYNQTK